MAGGDVEERRGSRSGLLRGCIRRSKGPWLVRRSTKDGKSVTRLRYPSERERLNNKERERRRRIITHNIFAGLRAHGNYHLPKHADTNDLLKALCQEAGWHVHADGTIFKINQQKPKSPETQSLVVLDSPCCQVAPAEDQNDYCKCDEEGISASSDKGLSSACDWENMNLNLTL